MTASRHIKSDGGKTANVLGILVNEADVEEDSHRHVAGAVCTACKMRYVGFVCVRMAHLYKLVGLKDQLEDSKSPVNGLQMVDLILRSLPTQTCHYELRKKVFFSSNTIKYTPEMVREMILTTGNSRAKNEPGSAAETQKGGKIHYKSNWPNLLGEEKPSGRKNAQATCARSGAKLAESDNADPAGDASDPTLKRKVVVGEAVKWAADNYGYKSKHCGEQGVFHGTTEGEGQQLEPNNFGIRGWCQRPSSRL
ncbi:hypothetical protein ON010_g6134 [Phytophthora cinnamomi]|nr:hypothetical protein ON010_g6134 [Phytophthora cinnamomi]